MLYPSVCWNDAETEMINTKSHAMIDTSIWAINYHSTHQDVENNKKNNRKYNVEDCVHPKHIDVQVPVVHLISGKNILFKIFQSIDNISSHPQLVGNKLQLSSGTSRPW